MKRVVLTFIITILLVSFTSTAYGEAEIIKVNTDSNTVSIMYDTTDYSDLKVMVKKGSEKYFYNLYSSHEDFPLQMGSGEYTVGLYHRVAGKKYKQIEIITFNMSIEDHTVFLASVQNVSWKSDSEAAILAGELTRDIQSDRKKAEVIYNYIVKNIEYDHNKAKDISSRYLPKVDEVLVDGKGICYDYASLMAVMLRSVNVPVKLVEGHSDFTSVYHAWNEVLLNNEWIIVDTTIDAAYIAEGLNPSFEKNASDYEVNRVF